MKIRPIVYLLSALLLPSIISCGNSDYDSDLRGKWQLYTSNIPYCGVDSVFLNFDNRIFFLQRVLNNRTCVQYTGKFTQKKDSLIFEFVDSFSVDTNGLFGYFNWDRKLKHSFSIEYLSAQKLKIKDQAKSFSFRKF